MFTFTMVYYMSLLGNWNQNQFETNGVCMANKWSVFNHVLVDCKLRGPVFFMRLNTV